MKLGIVLVCIAAGVLLVANASEHEDDGHTSLVGYVLCARKGKGLHAMHAWLACMHITFCFESAVRAASRFVVFIKAVNNLS